MTQSKFYVVTLFAQGATGGSATPVWLFSTREKAQAFIDSGQEDYQSYNSIEDDVDRAEAYDILTVELDSTGEALIDRQENSNEHKR